MLQFLRTHEWAVARRAILVVIIAFVVYSRYGGGLPTLFSRPNPKRDIQITKTEFRPDIAAKPIWIIGFRNASRSYTYERIELEASYFDKEGAALPADKLIVYQRLDPLQEKTIASPDFKERPAAVQGTLTVLDAQRVK